MGAPSLSSLESVCNDLPDYATCASRCNPTDIDNIRPVFEKGVETFGAINAVLMNYRPDRAGPPETLEGYVSALTNLSKVAHPYLFETQGRFVIVGQRMGKKTLAGALKTMLRNASRTLSEALRQEWSEDMIQVSLVEPDGLDGPKPMARRIARTLNGAPPRRPVSGKLRAAQ